MATPPKRLRAHEAWSWLRQRRCELPLPPLSAHAGGVAAKRGDAKAAEDILARLASEAAAKLNRMSIGDLALLEHDRESCLVELRIVTRPGKASHVDDGLDAGLTDDRYEFFRTPGPMPDRPDDHCAKGGVSLLPTGPRP